MSSLSMDHQESEGVTGNDELNGHSSRSSSLSLEEAEDGEECVQNVASASMVQKTGGDTDVKSNEEFDTLTSSNTPTPLSSDVCRPEQDHQDVVVVQTREERDNNQSTIHNNDNRVSNSTNNSRHFFFSIRTILSHLFL